MGEGSVRVARRSTAKRGGGTDGRESGARTILVVDDDPNIRTLLSDFLGQIGFVVIPAKDSRTTLVVLSHLPVHLILLDLALPDIYGLDLLPQLRSRYPSVPVVVISGYLTQESERQCFESGAASVIRKPVKLADLDRVIASALGAPPGARRTPGRKASDRRDSEADRGQG